MERDIQLQSQSRIRCFQLFFNSAQEALSGSFRAQALAEKDVDAMYPKHKQAILAVKNASFMFIMAVNDGVSPGHAFIANTIV